MHGLTSSADVKEDLSGMLEDDEVRGDLLAAETGVSLVAVGRLSIELAVKVIQRRLGYMHAPAHAMNTEHVQ